MGSPILVPIPRPDDREGIVKAIRVLASLRLNADSTPTFASLTLKGLTASRLLATNSAKLLVSSDLYAWLTQTTNQVLIADDGDGKVTFSLPQDIHTGASPTFAGATFTQVVTGIIPTSGDHFVTKEYVDLAFGSSIDYFLSDTATGIGSNYFMYQKATGESQSTLTSSGLSQGDGQLIFSFLTEAGEPGIRNLREGIYDAHAHFNNSTGDKPTTLYFTISKVDSDGSSNESLVLTSENTDTLTDSDLAYDIHASLGTAFTFNVTDRLLLKIYANVGASGSSSTVVMTIEGTTGSHITVSVPSDIWQHQGDVLDDLNTVGQVGADSEFLVGTAAGVLAWESGNIARTSLGLGTGNTPTFTQVILSTEPEAVSHAVTKSYADALVAGAFWEDVMVATIANINLATDLEAGDIIDDYTLVEGDRVLVKEQTDQTANGLYVVPASGTASRTSDADTADEIEGKKCIILEGALTKHRFYFCITGNITLGVTDIRFAEVTLMGAHNSLSGLQGGTVGPPTEYYHLTSAEHVELTAWLDDVVLSNGGAMSISGALTATNFTAANLLTACATNAGGLDFGGAYTLTVGETITTTSYHTASRAATWLAANHETTYAHADIALNTTHRGVSSGNPHSVTPTELSLLIGTDVLAQQTIGIANNNLLEVDHVSPADNDYAKFTAAGLEGRSYSEVRTDLGLVIGTDVQAYDAELASLAGLTYAVASFVKMTGANTFALRTIAQTADDLEGTIDHNNLANTHASNIFSTIAVSGQSNVVADSDTDTLTLVAGSNITITTDAGADSVTITSTGGGALNDLSDVTITSVGNGEVLGYNAGWINRTLAEAGIQPLDAELTSLASLSYVAASFVKMTATNTFALRTIAQTADDLEGTIVHNNLASVHQGVATGDSPTFAGITIANEGTIGRPTGPVLTFDDTGSKTLLISKCLTKYRNVDGGQTEQILESYRDSTAGSLIRFQHAKGTFDSPTIVTNGMEAGEFRMQCYDGSGFISIASIVAAMDGTPSSGNMPGRILFKTLLTSGAPIERLRIASDGGIFMYGLKTGTTQGGAGAAADELWVDTDDGNTIKLGT